MRNMKYLTLALFAGMVMPLGIWVAAGSALLESRKRRRLTSQVLARMA